MDLTIIQSSVALFAILCVIIVFASVFMRSRFFTEIFEGHPKPATQIIVMVFFGILSIFGTLSGLSNFGAVVNIRDLGPMAAGLLCGPYIGLGAGIIGGLFRFAQGGPYMWTGLSAPILSGILGGVMYLANKRQFVPTWVAVVLIGLSETLISCYTLILVTKPVEFFTVVTTVAIPMIVFNAIGMFIFATVVHLILDERQVQKQVHQLELEVASKRNLNTIINTIAYPVYVMDRDHRFTLVNDSICRFIGRAREEILGKTPGDLFSKADSAFHWIMTENVFRTHTSREDEVTITRPGGLECNLISTSTIYTDTTGHEFMVGVIQDITKRKMAEKAFREGEEKYRSTIDALTDAVSVVDRDFKVIIANTRLMEWLRDLGYSDDIIGKQILDAVPFLTTSVLDEYRAIFSTGTIFASEESTKVGNEVILTETRKIPVKEQGEIVAVVSIIRDITERKRVERELQESGETFKALAENANDGILVTLTGKTYSYANRRASEITGYSNDELLRIYIKDLAAPEELEKVTERFRKIIQGEPAPFQDETIIISKDGKRVPIEVNSAKTVWNGQPADMVIVRDVTERRQTEDRIRHALAEKEVLLREIHHRVKNNLAGIISLINLQCASHKDPATISLLRDLETRIRSMVLVHESLYQTEDLARINVANYTENLARYLFQIFDNNSGVRYHIATGDCTLPIETAIPFGLVITEIITNSLKYAFPETFSCEEIRGGPCTISLSMHREGDDYVLNIADNGIGIPERTNVHISQSLGMYLIRLIVEHQLRGSLGINTTRGTAYAIRFPEPVVKNSQTI